MNEERIDLDGTTKIRIIAKYLNSHDAEPLHSGEVTFLGTSDHGQRSVVLSKDYSNVSSPVPLSPPDQAGIAASYVSAGTSQETAS